jgi:Outer membrane protein beta-barrel domain
MATCRVLALGCFVFAWLLISPPAAQAADSAGIGLVAGVNINSVSLKGSDATNINEGSKVGLYAGVFAVLPLSSMFAIQPEIAYSQKHFTVKDTVGTFSAVEKWNWIEVPVLARISFWRGGNSRLFVLAGPAVSFRAGAKESVGGTDADVKNDVKSTDVSLIGGVGFEMKHVGLEARYDAGFKDLNNNNALGDLLTVKDHAFRVDVTWRFR